MIHILKDSLLTTNGFVLLFKGTDDRFDASLQQMLRDVEIMFGKSFWDHVILGFSFWAYDDRSIANRKRK